MIAIDPNELLKNDIEKLQTICATLCRVIKYNVPNIHVKMLMRDLSFQVETHTLIVCKDSKIMTNRHLLMSRSTFAREILEGQNGGGQIDLPTFTCRSVFDLLDYICVGRPPDYLSKFDPSRIAESDQLFELASKFDVPGLCFCVEAFRVGGISPEIDEQIENILRQEIHYPLSIVFTMSISAPDDNYSCLINKIRAALSCRFGPNITYKFTRISGDDTNLRVEFSKNDQYLCAFVHKIPIIVKEVAAATRRREALKKINS